VSPNPLDATPFSVVDVPADILELSKVVENLRQ
jgi:hypothetical protein